MSEWPGQWHRVDVVILTALRLEYDAVLQVDAGAVQSSSWEHTTGPSGLPLTFRSFEVPLGRPLRVAVAVAAEMGATAATNTLLPLVEALKPRCIAMCGVCAGRPEKTQLGDVVAASRLFDHDTGKRLPARVQHDLTTYQLRDDWKAALAGMEVVARFRDANWFRTRPLTTEWRERHALVALHNGDAAPGQDLDQKTWAATVAALQEQKLLAGRTLTDDGHRVIEDLLFRYQGRLPDLSPAGDFQPLRLHVGPMASGSQVIEDKAIWGSIAQSVRTVLGLDMEAAALGQLAHCQRQYGLDATVMKGVMDFADRGRDDHFKEFAARAAAECLLAFLRDQLPTETIAGFDDILTTGTSPPPEHAPSPSSLLVARHTVVPWHDPSATLSGTGSAPGPARSREQQSRAARELQRERRRARRTLCAGRRSSPRAARAPRALQARSRASSRSNTRRRRLRGAIPRRSRTSRRSRVRECVDVPRERHASAHSSGRISSRCTRHWITCELGLELARRGLPGG